MKLQEVRRQAGLSQSELAKLSGVKLRTIQEYENGRQNVLSNHELEEKIEQLGGERFAKAKSGRRRSCRGKRARQGET